MTDVVLVVNSGSSSLKFAVYRAKEATGAPIIKGKVAGIGRNPMLTASDGDGALVVTEPLREIPSNATHEWLIGKLLDRLNAKYVELNPVAAGHRVVHGGTKFTGPVLINADILKDLDALIPLAPLHQPLNLAAIRAVAQISPQLPQVACFDTSFHRTQPRLAQLFALPRKLTDKGIVRYGFHGLSYQCIAEALPRHLGGRSKGRVVAAHLGNGASMCAMKNGKSIASSMGFTALDGLMMGRRCGDLDPGVVLYLLEREGMTSAEVQKMLYRQSGLLGVSGISNNMQDLQASTDPAAREAIDLFCYRAARELASLAGALGGLDALVFTAGIGENAPEIRRSICDQAAWLGIELDEDSNERNDPRISTISSSVDVHVIPTNEEAVIAASTMSLSREAWGRST